MKDLYTVNYKTLMKEIRRHKQMDRYSMFLGGKNQYCENDYTTKCHLQIQCYPYQITNGFFHQTGMKIFTIHMETQKTPNSKKTVLRKKNAAATAKLLQSCPTLCDPIDGGPPGSPSLGFSRHEHGSGLPFPSPMHQSEK